jgi:hypothetical protein
MVDYRIPFVAGAFMSLISLIAVQCIRTGSNPPFFNSIDNQTVKD